MFQRDFTAITTASPEQLWPLYADVARWKEWDEGLDAVGLTGAFEKGARGTMRPHGQPALDFVLTEVTANVSFSDETRVGPLLVRFTHTLTRLTGGTRITHHVEVEGPGAEAFGTTALATVGQSVDRLARLGVAFSKPSLGGIILYVPEVHAAADFYVRAFGLSVQSTAGGNSYVQLQGPVPLAFAAESFIGSTLPVQVRPSRAAEAPMGAELMLVFADVEAAYARAVKAGAVAVSAPVLKPWGQQVAYVRDAQGVLVELCSPW